MNKMLSPVATALSAVFCSLAFVMPAHAQAKAALTRDIDRSSAQPVSTYCKAQTNAKCILYKVPVGKRLIVETVSYEVTSFAEGAFLISIVFGQDVQNQYLVPGVGPNVYGVTPVLASAVINSSVSKRVYVATQPLRAYLDESQTFASVAYVNGGIDTEQIFSFSGYLVDK